MKWLAGLVLAGTIPAGVVSPTEIIWITPAGEIAAAGCELESTERWICDQLPADPQGLLVILDASGALAYVPMGLKEVGENIVQWGRVLQIVAGSAAPEGIQHLRATARKPERSAYRTQSQRFAPIDDGSVHIVPLSDGAFWVAGGTIEKDAYVEIEGPAIATAHIDTNLFREGGPESPIVRPVAAPVTMTGRVQNNHGADVVGAVVELLEPLRSPRTGMSEPVLEPLLRRATTTSDANGGFTFDGLELGPYRVAAVEPRVGRGEVSVTSVSELVTVRLEAPVVATGRVLRHSLPVPDARIRFIPDIGAFLASTNTLDHITEEATTTADGRFLLPLPPNPSGVVQVIGPDDASVRVPLTVQSRSHELSVGDIVLPERRRVGALLVDGGGEDCALAAVGPLGRLGLATVRVTLVEGLVWWFDLPEAGEWALSANCRDVGRDIRPLTVAVPPTGPDPIFEALPRNHGLPNKCNK